MVGFGVVGFGVGFCVGLFVGRLVGFEVRYDWSLTTPVVTPGTGAMAGLTGLGVGSGVKGLSGTPVLTPEFCPVLEVEIGR